jgi:hypothetical protein
MKTRALIFLFVSLATLVIAQQVEPPMPPSPISEFRGWLAQSPSERKVALAKRPAKSRLILEQKIEEYSALPAAERQRRLAATELQWYLKPLLNMPKAKRDSAVQKIPAPWQPLVLERLAQWDKMPPDLQKQVLNHQLVVAYLSTPVSEQQAVLRSLTNAERDLLQQRIARWKILPAVERVRMDERLNDFFNMRTDKQEQALNNFSDAERQTMQKALDAFRGLTREQRQVCIQSFGRFASRFAAMSAREQIAFLKNAERWQELSQQDRDMWRQVVAIVPPMPALTMVVPVLPPVTPPAPRAQ